MATEPIPYFFIYSIFSWFFILRFLWFTSASLPLGRLGNIEEGRNHQACCFSNESAWGGGWGVSVWVCVVGVGCYQWLGGSQFLTAPLTRGYKEESWRAAGCCVFLLSVYWWPMLLNPKVGFREMNFVVESPTVSAQHKEHYTSLIKPGQKTKYIHSVPPSAPRPWKTSYQYPIVLRCIFQNLALQNTVWNKCLYFCRTIRTSAHMCWLESVDTICRLPSHSSTDIFNWQDSDKQMTNTKREKGGPTKIYTTSTQQWQKGSVVLVGCNEIVFETMESV